MAQSPDDLPKLSSKKLKSIVRNEEKTALAAKLKYVSDSEVGIGRKKKGKGFEYLFEGSAVKDDETLLRIKQLAIPPAWKRVWICSQDNGHLQATGYDAKGRKQYRYHANWNQLRNHTKFYKTLDFGKCLPEIRKQLKKDLSDKELTLRKVLATVVSLMEHTQIRIGSAAHEKENGSFGLTTFNDRHVTFKGNAVKFSFKGKKGIHHTVNMRNKKLAHIIRQCKEVPGRKLFQFYDDEGNRQSIDSGMVNEYIREISGKDFTAKDFRTWSGTIYAFQTLEDMGCCETVAVAKRKINEAIDAVSNQLGNTRAVCRKYYVHPKILEMYEDKRLRKYFLNKRKEKYNFGDDILTPDEQAVIHILKTN